MTQALDIAQNLIDNRCRYCGVESGQYHHKHCNIVISAKLEIMVNSMSYKLEKIARDLDIVTYDLRSLMNDMELETGHMVFKGNDS